jgi:hypothetical protein
MLYTNVHIKFAMIRQNSVTEKTIWERESHESIRSKLFLDTDSFNLNNLLGFPHCIIQALHVPKHPQPLLQQIPAMLGFSWRVHPPGDKLKNLKSSIKKGKRV